MAIPCTPIMQRVNCNGLFNPPSHYFCENNNLHQSEPKPSIALFEGHTQMAGLIVESKQSDPMPFDPDVYPTQHSLGVDRRTTVMGVFGCHWKLPMLEIEH